MSPVFGLVGGITACISHESCLFLLSCFFLFRSRTLHYIGGWERTEPDIHMTPQLIDIFACDTGGYEYEKLEEGVSGTSNSEPRMGGKPDQWAKADITGKF